MTTRLLYTLSILLVLVALVSAHGEEMAGMLPDDAPMFHWPEEQMTWPLKVHLALCIIAYVAILPTSLVMELASHRYQWLVQLAGALVAFVGIVFGWVHGHVHNAYARFGWFMIGLLALQTATNLGVALGVLRRGSKGQRFYWVLGGLQLVFTYMGMVLGIIRFLNLCSQGHLGQCISHFVRGSALMAGAVGVLVTMRVFGSTLLVLRRPLELYISIIMVTVGLIGTFTEHNFFQSSAAGDDTWSHKDLQHTLIGISWFAGGLLGGLMTWRAHPQDRTPIPSIIFIATGISMIIHQQDLAMSSHAHFLFGAALVSLGFSTICEITLVSSGFVSGDHEPRSFQYLSVFFMCAAGMFLMGANRDMVLFLINSDIDIVTYGLVLLSFCFTIVLYFYLLVDLYFALGGPPKAKYYLVGGDSSNRSSMSSQISTHHLSSPPPSTTGFVV